MRTTRVMWAVVALFIALLGLVPNAWAQKGGYGTYVSGGHENDFTKSTEVRGWGYGNISNNVVTQSFSGSSDAWADPENPSIIHWQGHMRLGGSFIPDDGHVTPTMAAIASSLDGWQNVSHYRSFEVAKWEHGGEFDYVRFDPVLTISISGWSNLVIGKGDWPWGAGNVNLNVTNGFIQNSSSAITLLDETLTGGAKSWWADFDFSGVSVPNKVAVVPEPTSIVLLVCGLASGLVRRRRA